MTIGLDLDEALIPRSVELEAKSGDLLCTIDARTS